MVITKHNYVAPKIDLLYFSCDVVLESGDVSEQYDNIGRVTSNWIEEE